MEYKNSLHWGSYLFSSEVQEDDVVLLYKYRLLILVTLITGLLMWTYSFISIFFVEVQALGRIGVGCSVVHAFSPIIYRVTKSMKIAAYSMVTSGMIFQFSFSFFTGGFFSPTLLWFAVLPLIVGLLTNKTHAVIWTFLSVSAYMLMFWLQKAGLVPESTINDLGRTLAQFMIGLGLIGLVGGFTVFFLELSYFYYQKDK